MIGLNCYRFFKNECNDACQGGSNCPIALPSHDENAPTGRTRMTMLKFGIGNIYYGIKWWVSWRKRKEIGKIISEVLEKYKEKI